MKRLSIALGLFLICQFTRVAFAQADESGTAFRATYSVGASISDSSTDWSKANLLGFSLRANAEFFNYSSVLRRISVEAEYRDLQFNRPDYVPQLQLQTIQGGLKARIFSRRRFSAYGKGVIGRGFIDFPVDSIAVQPTLSSKQNLVYSAGGGGEYRTSSRVSVRAEYWSQWWPDLADRNTALTPHGVDVGVTYRIR
jgi:opacity protein-like surface antigen